MSSRPIRPIRSDSDYDAALEEIESLFDSEPGTEDADRLEVLVVLAQDYQRTFHPVSPPDMQSVIEFELDRRGLTRQDTAGGQDTSEAVGNENRSHGIETGSQSTLKSHKASVLAA